MSNEDNRVSAWRRFVDRIESYIKKGGSPREQPKEEIEALLSIAAIPGENQSDLQFNHSLAVFEVIEDGVSKGWVSKGWDITYNCLAASQGDFEPFNPPEYRGELYATREQALIALVGWFNEQSQESFIMMWGNESNDIIDVRCPGCNLPFEIDSDGDILQIYHPADLDF